MTTSDLKKKRPSGAKSKAITAAAAAVLAGYLLVSESGKKTILVPYYDSVGVLTVCDGLIGAWIDPKKKYTVEECATRKADYIRRMAATFGECTGPLTDKQWVWIGHVAYNVGAKGFCGSSMASNLAAENYVQACGAIYKWDVLRIKGKVVHCRLNVGKVDGCRGIMNRRQFEYKLCMDSLE